MRSPLQRDLWRLQTSKPCFVPTLPLQDMLQYFDCCCIFVFYHEIEFAVTFDTNTNSIWSWEFSSFFSFAPFAASNESVKCSWPSRNILSDKSLLLLNSAGYWTFYLLSSAVFVAPLWLRFLNWVLTFLGTFLGSASREKRSFKCIKINSNILSENIFMLFVRGRRSLNVDRLA